jgi:uncharacterized protein (DUF433 family)
MSKPVEAGDAFWKRRLTIPFYKVSEAARYARSNAQTVARWHQLQVVPGKQPREELSYLQLVELAVASAIRKAQIPLKEIKQARDFFGRKLETEFPFATHKFKADGRKIVLEYHEIEPKSGFDKLYYSDGQLGWKDVVDRLLREFEYDASGLAVRWRVGGIKSQVLIDPQLAFGAPQVEGAATWILKDRYLSGESVQDIASDFDLETDLVVDALTFENIPEVDMGRPRLWVN